MKNQTKVSTVASHGTDKKSQRAVLRKLAASSANLEPFALIDIGDVYRKHRQWLRMLPRIEPFYAAKCNSDAVIVRSLITLGSSFDCASKAEMEFMLTNGCEPTRIIYAHPCKPPSHIRFAYEHGVEMMTFDNEDELLKIKSIHPTAKLVLRVLTDTSKATCSLGKKFGVVASEAYDLLTIAKANDLNVIGVSFHVGSGCFDASAYSDAVEVAHGVFKDAERVGYKFSLLDVGGGFPGDDKATLAFKDVANVLNAAVERFFPPESNVRIIAEPGRYYVSSCITLVVNVVSKRKIRAERVDEAPSFFYYLNDGAYGSLNNVMYDHATPVPIPLRDELVDAPVFRSTLWGPTCDSMDCINRDILIPEFNLGDWLVFENAGAYTIAAGSTFNGFPRPKSVYTFSAPEWFDSTELPDTFPVPPVSHDAPESIFAEVM